MDKAQDYNDYWNKSRVHSGIGMNNSTLRKKLLDLGYYNTDRILDLNVLYFDSYFYPLQRHLEYFYFPDIIK